MKDKTSQENNNELLASSPEEDIGSCPSFFQNLKYIVFNLVFHMLNGERVSFSLRIFLIIFETAQIIHFYFRSDLLGYWLTSVPMDKILGYSLIMPQFEQSPNSYSQYTIIFYVCIAAQILIIADIGYILYKLSKRSGTQQIQIRPTTGSGGGGSSSQSQQIITWPLSLLRFTAELALTVVYLPLFELYMSVFKCNYISEDKASIINQSNTQSNINQQPINAQYYHLIFREQRCFSGQHITLSLLGGLFGLLLVVFVCALTLIFFGSRQNSRDCNAKFNGRNEFWLFIFKTMLVLSSTFFVSMGNEGIHLIVISFGAFAMFEQYNINLSHLNMLVARFLLLQRATVYWTVLCLLLGMLQLYSQQKSTQQQSQVHQFNGQFSLWLIGLPLISVLVATRKEICYDILLVNSNNYDVLNQPLQQLPYLVLLLSRYESEKCVKVLMDGFYDFHTNICDKEDCPSKRRVLKTTKLSKTLKTQGKSDQYIQLILVIQNMFYHALQKFPNSTKLRILYALYLLDKMQSKQQALQEFINAEVECPLLDEEFQIYRYKIIIENELLDVQSINNGNGAATAQASAAAAATATATANGGGGNNTTSNSGGEGAKKEATTTTQNIQQNLEIMNEITVQNHYNLCRMNIEKSTFLHVEFWSQLLEESPDLGKLSELGYKIAQFNSAAEEQWGKLIKMNAVVQQLIRLYALFLAKILSDKEGGLALMARLSDVQGRGTNSQLAGIFDLGCEAKPTIIISAEDDSFGLITNANLAASTLFGYNKMDVLNKKINMMMPEIYSEYHDMFLENYLATLEPRILNYDRLLPGLTKQGYLQMVVVFVRHVPSLIHGTQFVATIRTEKTLHNIGYIITSTEGDIQCISASCITLLGVDQRRIRKKKKNIQDSIPHFLDMIDLYKQKQGARETITSLDRKRQHKMIAQIFVQDIAFRSIGHQGYLIKIELIDFLNDEEGNDSSDFTGIVNALLSNNPSNSQQGLKPGTGVTTANVAVAVSATATTPGNNSNKNVISSSRNIHKKQSDGAQSNQKVITFVNKESKQSQQHQQQSKQLGDKLFGKAKNMQGHKRHTYLSYHFELKYDLSNNVYVGEMYRGHSNQHLGVGVLAPELNNQEQNSLSGNQSSIQIVQASSSLIPIEPATITNQVGNMRKIIAVGNMYDSVIGLNSNHFAQHNLNNDSTGNLRQKVDYCISLLSIFLFLIYQIDYGAGIRTVRVVRNRLEDIEDLKKEEEMDEDDEFDESSSQNNNNKKLQHELRHRSKNAQGFGDDLDQGESEEANNISNVFRKRKAFLKFIEDSNFLTSQAVQALKYTAGVYALLMIVFCVVSDLITNGHLNSFTDRYRLIGKAHLLVAQEQTMLTKIFNLMLINEGIDYFLYDESISAVNSTQLMRIHVISDLRKQIGDTLLNIQNLQTELQLQTLGDLLPEHAKLASESPVPMMFIQEGKSSNSQKKLVQQSQQFGLNEATQLILSKLNRVYSSYNLGNELSYSTLFDVSNPDYFFLQYNLLNSYTLYQQQSANFFVEELALWNDDKKGVFSDLLVASFVVVATLLVFLLPFYFLAHKSQMEVLQVFLDIPQRRVKRLFESCENYLAHLQGNGEDGESHGGIEFSSDSSSFTSDDEASGEGPSAVGAGVGGGSAYEGAIDQQLQAGTSQQPHNLNESGSDLLLSSNIHHQRNHHNNNSSQQAYYYDSISNRRRSRNRKKLSLISMRNRKMFFLPCLICCIVLECYSLMTFESSQALSQHFSQFIKELNNTSVAEGAFALAHNAVRSLLFDYTFPVHYNFSFGIQPNDSIQTSSTVVVQLVEDLFILSNQLQTQHQQNLNIHSPGYIDAFQQIYIKDSCDLLSSMRQVSLSQCEGFADAIVASGLSASVMRQLENLNEMVKAYEMAQMLTRGQFNESTQPNMYTQMLKNRTREVFLKNQTSETTALQDKFIKYMFRYLVDQFIASINVEGQHEKETRLTILIIGLILISFVYSLFWVPVLNNVSREIMRVRSMVLMIPLDVCTEVRSIRMMLQSYLSKMYVQNDLMN